MPIPVTVGDIEFAIPGMPSLGALEYWLRKVIGIDFEGLEFRCTLLARYSTGDTLIAHFEEIGAERVVLGSTASAPIRPLLENPSHRF